MAGRTWLLELVDTTGRIASHQQPVPEIRLDLFQLFDPTELGKYFTETESGTGSTPAVTTGGEAK